MWLLLSLFFVFLGNQTPPVASSEDLNNLMGRNVRKQHPEMEDLPKTPPSKEDELSRPTKPKPKPKPIKPAPTPPVRPLFPITLSCWKFGCCFFFIIIDDVGFWCIVHRVIRKSLTSQMRKKYSFPCP